MALRQDHIVFEPGLPRQRMTRALAQGPFADFIYKRTAEDICERLGGILRQFSTTLVVADAPDGFAERLQRSGQHETVVRAGQCEGGHFVGDFEHVPVGRECVDCIISVLNLHAINDLPGVLAQYRQALRPDGLFMAAMLGGETLYELRQAWIAAEMLQYGGVSPRVAPFADVRSLGGLLQRAGFALPVVDSERTTVRYGSALAAMRELKQMGWSNALQERSRRPVTKGLLAAAVTAYEAQFAGEDRRIPMTLEIVHLTGWAPHESQQKPLKPGSAKMRLADALKVAACKPEDA